MGTIDSSLPRSFDELRQMHKELEKDWGGTSKVKEEVGRVAKWEGKSPEQQKDYNEAIKALGNISDSTSQKVRLLGEATEKWVTQAVKTENVQKFVAFLQEAHPTLERIISVSKQLGVPIFPATMNENLDTFQGKLAQVFHLMQSGIRPAKLKSVLRGMFDDATRGNIDQTSKLLASVISRLNEIHSESSGKPLIKFGGRAETESAKQYIERVLTPLSMLGRTRGGSALASIRKELVESVEAIASAPTRKAIDEMDALNKTLFATVGAKPITGPSYGPLLKNAEQIGMVRDRELQQLKKLEDAELHARRSGVKGIDAQKNKLETLIALRREQVKLLDQYVPSVVSSLGRGEKLTPEDAAMMEKLGLAVDKTRVSKEGLAAIEAKSKDIRAQATRTIKDATGAMHENTVRQENWKNSILGTNKATFDMTQQMITAFKKLIAYRSIFYTMRGAMRIVKEQFKSLTEYQYELANIQKVAIDRTIEQNRLFAASVQYASTYGSSIKEIIESMKTWAQQGKTQQEVIELTNATLLATASTNMTVHESIEALTAAVKAYNVEAARTPEVVAKWMAVQARHAVTAQDLANAMKVLAATAEVVGVDLDEFMGYVTAIAAVTRKTGKAVANSLKTMFARISNDKVIEQLGTIDISVYDLQGDLRNLDDILTDLAGSWEGLNRAQKVAIARALGGVRRYADFMVLMENWDEKLLATVDSLEAQDEAVRAVSIDLDTMKKVLEANKQVWKGLGAEIAGSEFGMHRVIKGYTQMSLGLGRYLTENKAANKVVKETLGLLQSLSLGALAAVGGYAAVTFIIHKLIQAKRNEIATNIVSKVSTDSLVKSIGYENVIRMLQDGSIKNEIALKKALTVENYALTASEHAVATGASKAAIARASLLTKTNLYLAAGAATVVLIGYLYAKSRKATAGVKEMAFSYAKSAENAVKAANAYKANAGRIEELINQYENYSKIIEAANEGTTAHYYSMLKQQDVAKGLTKFFPEMAYKINILGNEVKLTTEELKNMSEEAAQVATEMKEIAKARLVLSYEDITSGLNTLDSLRESLKGLRQEWEANAKASKDMSWFEWLKLLKTDLGKYFKWPGQSGLEKALSQILSPKKLKEIKRMHDKAGYAWGDAIQAVVGKQARDEVEKEARKLAPHMIKQWQDQIDKFNAHVSAYNKTAEASETMPRLEDMTLTEAEAQDFASGMVILQQTYGDAMGALGKEMMLQYSRYGTTIDSGKEMLQKAMDSLMEQSEQLDGSLSGVNQAFKSNKAELKKIADDYIAPLVEIDSKLQGYVDSWREFSQASGLGDQSFKPIEQLIQKHSQTIITALDHIISKRADLVKQQAVMEQSKIWQNALMGGDQNIDEIAGKLSKLYTEAGHMSEDAAKEMANNAKYSRIAVGAEIKTLEDQLKDTGAAILADYGFDETSISKWHETAIGGLKEQKGLWNATVKLTKKQDKTLADILRALGIAEDKYERIREATIKQLKPLLIVQAAHENIVLYLEKANEQYENQTDNIENVMSALGVAESESLALRRSLLDTQHSIRKELVEANNAQQQAVYAASDLEDIFKSTLSLSYQQEESQHQINKVMLEQEIAMAKLEEASGRVTDAFGDMTDNVKFQFGYHKRIAGLLKSDVLGPIRAQKKEQEALMKIAKMQQGFYKQIGKDLSTHKDLGIEHRKAVEAANFGYEHMEDKIQDIANELKQLDMQAELEPAFKQFEKMKKMTEGIVDAFTEGLADIPKIHFNNLEKARDMTQEIRTLEKDISKARAELNPLSQDYYDSLAAIKEMQKELGDMTSEQERLGSAIYAIGQGLASMLSDIRETMMDRILNDYKESLMEIFTGQARNDLASRIDSVLEKYSTAYEDQIKAGGQDMVRQLKTVLSMDHMTMILDPLRSSSQEMHSMFQYNARFFSGELDNVFNYYIEELRQLTGKKGESPLPKYYDTHAPGEGMPIEKKDEGVRDEAWVNAIETLIHNVGKEMMSGTPSYTPEGFMGPLQEKTLTDSIKEGFKVGFTYFAAQLASWMPSLMGGGTGAKVGSDIGITAAAAIGKAKDMKFGSIEMIGLTLGLSALGSIIGAAASQEEESRNEYIAHLAANSRALTNLTTAVEDLRQSFIGAPSTFRIPAAATHGGNLVYGSDGSVIAGGDSSGAVSVGNININFSSAPGTGVTTNDIVTTVESAMNQVYARQRRLGSRR